MKLLTCNQFDNMFIDHKSKSIRKNTMDRKEIIAQIGQKTKELNLQNAGNFTRLNAWAIHHKGTPLMNYYTAPDRTEAELTEFRDTLQGFLDNKLVPEPPKVDKQEARPAQPAPTNRPNPPRGQVSTGPDPEALAKFRAEQEASKPAPTPVVDTASAESFAKSTAQQSIVKEATGLNTPKLRQPDLSGAFADLNGHEVTQSIHKLMMSLIDSRVERGLSNIPQPSPTQSADNTRIEALEQQVAALKEQQAKLTKMLTSLIS